MKDHNSDNNNDPMDNYIRQEIKNWAAQETPPAHVRTRILLVAASPLSQQVRSSSQEDMYRRIIPLASEFSLPNQVMDPFKQSWLLVLHPSLIPHRYIP